MTEAENLTLHYLRRIDEKVDRLAGDMREVKARLVSLEDQTAFLGRLMADGSGEQPPISVRLDRMNARLERIERRLELSGPG